MDDPEHLTELVRAFNKLAASYKLSLSFSVHPRTRKRLQAGRHKLHKLIRTMPPLGFFDYVALQKAAFCTLSDSGTIAEEASILGFPAVTCARRTNGPKAWTKGLS